MSLKKSQLKEIIKECLLEILIEPAFINEMKRTLSREVTRNTSIPKSKTGKLSYGQLKESMRINNIPAKKKKITGNPMLDEIIRNARPITNEPGAEDILDGMIDVPMGGGQQNIKVEVMENVDYSDFLSGIADDSKDPAPKIKKAPPISNVSASERIKV